MEELDVAQETEGTFGDGLVEQNLNVCHCLTAAEIEFKLVFI